jgi:uroporphyrinogen decarboxylase
MGLLDIPVTPNFDAFKRCVLRQREPERVHCVELLLDEDIVAAVADRFNLVTGIVPGDPVERAQRDMTVYRFLGYDTFPVALPGFDFSVSWISVNGAKAGKRPDEKKRTWIEEHRGPIQSWSDFERHPWPRLQNVDTSPLEWLDRNLYDGMKVFCWNDQVFERLFGLFGYEALCLKLYDDRELVEAVATRAGELCLGFTELLCQFSSVGIIWDSDDLGFKSQTLLPPEILRELVLPWHKKSAEIAHRHGKLYFSHSCGKVDAIMEDLIEDVKTDAKHSFEDAILPVTTAVEKYGDRIGILGGIDVDFLCRSSEADIRRRVRDTLGVCHPGGGYMLGSGNSIPNYMPLDNYLTMLDEGRRYATAQ